MQEVGRARSEHREPSGDLLLTALTYAVNHDRHWIGILPSQFVENRNEVTEQLPPQLVDFLVQPLEVRLREVRPGQVKSFSLKNQFIELEQEFNVLVQGGKEGAGDAGALAAFCPGISSFCPTRTVLLFNLLAA